MTCAHVSARFPHPVRRYEERCIRCNAILGYANPGAAEPCLTAWGLESATAPHTPEEIAAMRQRVAGRRAA